MALADERARRKTSGNEHKTLSYKFIDCFDYKIISILPITMIDCMDIAFTSLRDS
jgi:hypothetical protein